MFKKNKENEVIRMEQTTFIQRHAKKILIAGGLVVSAGTAYLLYKYNVDIKALKENHSLELGEIVKQHDIDICNHELRLTNVGQEVTLVADSGFKVDRDGFNFGNFGSSTSPGGVCYGFSYLTKQIYLNQLPESAEEVKEGTIAEKLIAYKLTDTNKKRLVKGNVLPFFSLHSMKYMCGYT